jgi:hypothetical protein
MNIHTPTDEAERAQSVGDAIYERLLPQFKELGLEAGHFVAINIATGEYVTAESSLDLMASYKKKFGQSVGWVREIDYRPN